MLPFVGFSFVGESNPPNQMIHLVVRCVSPMLGGFPRVRHLVSADALIRATKRSCLEFVCSTEIRFSVSGYLQFSTFRDASSWFWPIVG